LTDVSTGTVLALLGAEPSSARDTLLRTARDGQHKLAATLLSLWAAGGEHLTDEERAELCLGRERIDRYLQTWKQLQELAPGIFLLNGMTIAALYPPGVLRSAGDLDVICPTHADLWTCARHLAANGWEWEALTLGPVRRGDSVSHHLGVEFRRSAPDPSQEPAPPQEPYAIGLCTAEIVTDVRGPAWQLARASRSPLAASTVALVAERWERSFRSRDLLDLALLLQNLDEEGVRQVHDDLARTGLWPEWREAMRGIVGLGWQPAVVLSHTRAAAGRARLLRAARAALRWSNPVRGLAFAAQSGIEGEGGRFADVASDLVHRRVGTRRLLAAGVPLFGVPLDGERAGHLRLDDAGRHLVARTPLGSFLLVSGAARQEWIDEASGYAPSAAGTSASGSSVTGQSATGTGA
jgi:hypothetical protein